MDAALMVPRLRDVLRAESGPVVLQRSPCVSSICNSADFLTRGYQHWCQAVGEVPRWHRKQWEFVFIAQVLYERGMLAKGKRGLGFGVGNEPLPKLFRAHGATITATDAPQEVAQKAGWIQTDQWSSGVETCDMRAIPASYHAQYDFTWSSCCFEHLGSIEEGFRFLIEQGRCLKWGGVGVHTTELLMFKDDPSVDLKGTILFCKNDLLRLSDLLQPHGLRLVPIHWEFGRAVPDRYIDVEPYNEELHLRLDLDRHIATSIGLIIVRQSPPTSV